MLAAVLLLAVLAAVFAAAYFLLRRSLRTAARQLREITDTPDTNQKTTCAAPDKGLERLLEEVNRVLEVRRNEQVRYQRREQELRRQIANVSHDLRTPLTSILGYIGLLRDPSITPAEREEYLNVVEKRAKVLQTLIGSFYDLSRLEADEYALDQKPQNLYRLLCETAALFYGDFTARSYELELEADEHPPAVLADENAVIRVFTNLFQNALRHGRDLLLIRQWEEGDTLVTEFRNRTDEISEADIPHVFDRFFTSDRMRSGQNTGLGLTVAKKLLEGMGHTAEASLESRDGGTWFRIRILWSLRR